MSMYLRPSSWKGNLSWSIVKARHSGDRGRQSQVLCLGRLEHLSPEQRCDLERQVLALHDDKVLHPFCAQSAEFVLEKLGVKAEAMRVLTGLLRPRDVVNKRGGSNRPSTVRKSALFPGEVRG